MGSMFLVRHSETSETMLEDDFTYVLRKALVGQGISSAEAARRAGLAESDVSAFLGGTFSSRTARKIALVLGLREDALAAHDTYQPRPVTLAGVHRLDLPMGGEQVNAWLLRKDETLILFDAGYKTSDLTEVLDSVCGRLPDRVFITHAHRDHIGALSYLLRAGVPVHAAGIADTIPMLPGDTVQCGPLAVRACDLSGHAVPALGFHVEGLTLPVLVTGDALFAGSIGGCRTPDLYRLALRRLGEVLGPLSDATIILPGHGPATTLGEERAANPFL